MRQLAEAQNKKTAKKALVPDIKEHDIQVQCVDWFRFQHSRIANLLFAVPNGEKRETVTKMTKYGVKSWCPSGQRLKEEGAVSGVADLILLQKNSLYGALLIEMKTPKGKQSDEQKEWQARAESAGYKYVVCRSLDEFMYEVQNYLLTV